MKKLVHVIIIFILGFSCMLYAGEIYDAVSMFINNHDVPGGVCKSGDCKNGKGIMDSRYYYYEGEFKEGKFHGSGTIVMNGWSYTGQWQNGLMHGQGVLMYNSDESKVDSGLFVRGRYTGKCETGDCTNGTGRLTWADGRSYEGEVKDGMMDGTGTLIWRTDLYPSGTINYKGRFKNGMRDGTGTFTEPNSTYTGQWKDDMKSGRGTFECSQFTYKGQWKEDQPDGQGTLAYPDGSADTGRFIKGRYTGKCETGDCNSATGTLTWASGARYTGEVKDGMMNGTGTFTCKDYTFTGHYKNGLRNGRGIFKGTGYIPRDNDYTAAYSLQNNTATYDGEWKDDSMVYATGTWNFYKGTYTGEFRNWRVDGKGTMTFEDGSSYTGQWQEGRMNGEGTFTYPDGRKDAGMFKDDRYLGKCVSGDCTNGKGTATWADGSSYTGDFKDGERCGTGTMQNADGSRYTGEFYAGSYSGNGTLTENDGTVKKGRFSGGDYEGNCKAGDCENGYGEFDYPDSTSYRGEWKNGMYNGKGTYTGNESITENDPDEDFNDGQYHIYIRNSEYTGEWKDGEKEGYGTYSDTGGNVYEGEWKNDKKNGKGTMQWNEDGYRYEGEWKDDKQDGEGIMYNYDGIVYQKGHWKNGEYTGE